MENTIAIGVKTNIGVITADHNSASGGLTNFATESAESFLSGGNITIQITYRANERRFFVFGKSDSPEVHAMEFSTTKTFTNEPLDNSAWIGLTASTGGSRSVQTTDIKLCTSRSDPLAAVSSTCSGQPILIRSVCPSSLVNYQISIATNEGVIACANTSTTDEGMLCHLDNPLPTKLYWNCYS